MVFSKTLNSLFKDNGCFTISEKQSIVESLNTHDLFELLRNVEEDPFSYDEPVIKSVYGKLYNKGIICM